jgi:hypothetical protein
MQKRLLILYLVSGFLFASCQKKKEEALPDTTTPRETQSGRNTVYMTVNGKPMVPKVVGGESAYPLILVGMSYLNGLPGLRLRFNYEDQEKTSSLNLYSMYLNPGGIGVYPIGRGQTFIASYFKLDLPCDIMDASFEGTYSGTIEIKRFDPGQEIYSGTFHVKFWLPENPCDTIRIENGIFDVKGF